MNNLNILSEGLGGKHPIEVHGVSVTLPKPLSSDLWPGTSGSAMARGRLLTRRRRFEGGIRCLAVRQRGGTPMSSDREFDPSRLHCDRVAWQ